MNASHKVLVVDDDPVVRKSIDRVLSGKGYAVITAANGEEALRKLNEEKYDVVYTDIRMPGISGLEVAEQVKARRPWTPVVIMTGYGTEAAQSRAKSAGVSNFLHKPLSPEMIEDSARDAMAAPKAEVPKAEAQTAPVTAEAALPETVGKASVQEGGNASALKNILLFFAAPFIGLAYIVVLPFVGMGVFAVLAVRAATKIGAVNKSVLVAKHVGMAIAAPMVGLAYILFFPLIGLGTLLWLAGRAAVSRARN
jgi:CheY-like chemotaxis protein